MTSSQESFELAFQSSLKSDGFASKVWDIEMGKLLKNHHSIFPKKIEINNRVKTLKSIRNGILKPLAIECIKELNKKLSNVSDGVN